MKNLTTVAIGLATVTLILGYAFGDAPLFSWLWALLGLCWLIGQWRNWDWVISWGLVLFVGAAAFGVWLNAPGGWMLLSVLATLAAWDLAHFTARMRRAELGDEAAMLTTTHLRRLAMVIGLGLLLGGVALGVSVTLHLGWAIFLGLLAVIGLSQVMRFTEPAQPDRNEGQSTKEQEEKS